MIKSCVAQVFPLFKLVAISPVAKSVKSMDRAAQRNKPLDHRICDFPRELHVDVAPFQACVTDKGMRKVPCGIGKYRILIDYERNAKTPQFWGSAGFRITVRHRANILT